MAEILNTLKSMGLVLLCLGAPILGLILAIRAALRRDDR